MGIIEDGVSVVLPITLQPRSFIDGEIEIFFLKT